MGKFLLAAVAAFASLVLVEPLVCNNCAFSLLGVCRSQFNETCVSNSSVCYTGRSLFPVLPSFAGFNTQGCTNITTNCNTSSSYTMIGVTYTSTVTCCSSDRCNTVSLNGAPSTKMTFSAAAAGAILATVLGSIM